MNMTNSVDGEKQVKKKQNPELKGLVKSLLETLSFKMYPSPLLATQTASCPNYLCKSRKLAILGRAW